MSMSIERRSGLSIFVRDEAPRYDDKFTVTEIFDDDAYRFKKEWVHNGIVVDLGANIGTFSLLAASAGAKQVLSFEPEPHNLELLRMNVEANDFTSITVIPHAVGHPRTTYIDDGSGHSQIGRETGSPVEVVDINPFLDSFETISLLKCDCEGGEYEFFETISDENLEKIVRMVGEMHSFLWENDMERHQRMISRLEEYFTLTFWGYKNSTFLAEKK